jgi:hypothetical protein
MKAAEAALGVERVDIAPDSLRGYVKMLNQRGDGDEATLFDILNDRVASGCDVTFGFEICAR